MKQMPNFELCAWKYSQNTRNYPGVHLMATSQACDALLESLEIIQCQDNRNPSKFSVKGLDLTRERMISGGLRFQNFTHLALHYRPVSPELQQMCVSEIGDETLIETTKMTIEALRLGIEEMKRGNGDFSVGPRRSRREGLVMGDKDKRSLCLWFWSF